MLAVDEGFREKPYDDTTGKTIALPTGGKVTIGVGRNLTDRGLSEDEIQYLFRNDLIICLQAATRIFFDFHYYAISRQLAIINLLFNLGESKFRRFEDTIEHIRAYRWTEAAAALMDSKWYKQVGPQPGTRVGATRGERVVAMLKDDRYVY